MKGHLLYLLSFGGDGQGAALLKVLRRRRGPLGFGFFCSRGPHRLLFVPLRRLVLLLKSTAGMSEKTREREERAASAGASSLALPSSTFPSIRILAVLISQWENGSDKPSFVETGVSGTHKNCGESQKKEQRGKNEANLDHCSISLAHFLILLRAPRPASRAAQP